MFTILACPVWSPTTATSVMFFSASESSTVNSGVQIVSHMAGFAAAGGQEVSRQGYFEHYNGLPPPRMGNKFLHRFYTQPKSGGRRKLHDVTLKV
jgi:hypothetical protein